jgi:hypothetical protein
MHQQTGKWVILIGLLIVAAGLLIHFAGDRMRWIGRLPGDIRVEREHVRFYFPVTTMILLSLAVTGLLWLVRWIKGG